MKHLLIIPRALWKTLFLFNFVSGLLLLYPFFYISLSRKKWFPKAFLLFKIWGRWIFHLSGLFVKTKYKTPKEHLPYPAVYCSNHVSYLDIIASYFAVPNYFVFMGKQELDKAPLFRLFFKEMNILVDRKSNVASHRAFIRAGEDLEKGHSVFLFPEGTTSSDGKLRGFKNGAFRLAVDKQVPIVPIIFLNNWKLLQMGGFFKSFGRPGISRVIVCEPISTIGLTENDLITLRTRVYDIIQNELTIYNSK